MTVPQDPRTVGDEGCPGHTGQGRQTLGEWQEGHGRCSMESEWNGQRDDVTQLLMTLESPLSPATASRQVAGKSTIFSLRNDFEFGETARMTRKLAKLKRKAN